MIRHTETHIKEKCKFCGKIISKSIIASHVNREHVKSEQSMNCKNCGKRFLRKSNYKYHINTMPIDCRSCEMSFKCQDLWQKHKSELHKNGFRCKQCCYAAKSKKLFELHFSIHDKKFCCESCDKRFARKRDLKNHEIHYNHGAFRNVELLFQCVQCKKLLQSPNSLRTHISRSHQK